MQSQPLISVILPVYNGRKYLSASIESVLNQSYRNLELIIVDDASGDDSLKIARAYEDNDNRITILTNSKNRGLPSCLNQGHLKAKGSFLTWTSDDNYYHEDALLSLYEMFRIKDVDIVYSNYQIINEDGDITGESRLKPIEYLLFSGVIGACFLYKKEVFERNSGYNEKLFLVEDFDFWLRALKHSRFFKEEKPDFYYYRYHPESLTMKMASNPELKDKFIGNLNTLYQDLFQEMNLKKEEELINYIVDRFLNGAFNNVEVINNVFLLKDLDTVASKFPDFNSQKLQIIAMEDTVETILKNKKYHKLSVLSKLHSNIGIKLLYLPIKRYLALWKKCLI